MKKQILLTLSLATLLATATQASQEQLARSIRDTQSETSRTSAQLKATLNALNALTKQSKGDLRPAYDSFSSEVTRTEAVADLTRARVRWMGQDGRAYFQDWQRTIDGLANESLRKKSQKRLDSVKAGYNKIESSLQLASDKFKPFLSDLGDIKKALSTDVTAGGVKAMRSTVSTANWDHNFVNDAIKSALKEMDKVGKALSSEAK